MTMPVPAAGNDPFADPVTPPSSFPTQASFRARLVLITPRKIETVPNTMNPGQTQERITADVSVVDGLGPVPQMKSNQHTGQFLEGPDFTGVWFNGTRLVEQMRPFVGTGRSVLGVIETYKPGEVPVKGNPWGLITATDEQKQQALSFLASRKIGQAAAPAPQPQVSGPVLAPPQHYVQTVPAPAPQAAPIYAPQPQAAAPAPVQGNPFGQAPAAAPPASAPNANPFA